ncbi:MAG: MBL fold metallo-hydrolase [Terriglobales bacterium]
MVRSLSITAVVENTAGAFDFLGEWGLSLWIEADSHRILYDTGQGRSLLENSRLLRIDLKTAEALVTSHGHSDHTGGIAQLMAAGFRGKVYAHPAAFAKKYQREPNSVAVRSKGIPDACEQALRRWASEIVDSSAPTKIAPGMMVTGAIPRRTDFEDTGGAFFLDHTCTKPDPLLDDQALLIETPRGWVVITGCGHAGVVNTVKYAVELTGTHRIHAVVGGMHLANASEHRIKATAEQLKNLGVELIAPCHCTGFAATGFFQSQFGAQVVVLRAGLSCRFGD